MLGPLESKLTAEVAEALAGRNEVVVQTAPLPLTPPSAGQRSIRVWLEELLPGSAFESGRTALSGESPDRRARRVVELAFIARVRATARPEQPEAPSMDGARQLLMEDLSLVVHGLDGPRYRDGSDLAGGGADPGYEVLEFRLSKGAIQPELIEGCLTGELEYRGKARIWPPEVSEAGAEIRTIETVLEPMPVEIRASQPVVRAGAQTVVRVRLLSRRRTTGAGPVPLRLAATVLGDLPPAERGSVSSGTPGADAAFRLHQVGDAATEITYAAPSSGVGRARTEYVAVHLATPDGSAGVFLGSAPIRVVPGTV
jgi:hypothetical protein